MKIKVSAIYVEGGRRETGDIVGENWTLVKGGLFDHITETQSL